MDAQDQNYEDESTHLHISLVDSRDLLNIAPQPHEGEHHQHSYVRNSYSCASFYLAFACT
jgi:hypothetical protein